MSDSSQPAPISKQRLHDARRLGASPRSSELTSGVVLLVAGWVSYVGLPPLCQAIRDLASSGFHGTTGGTINVTSELGPAVVRVGQELFRIAIGFWAAAVLSDLVQVGFVWSPLTVMPHEERISPISGLARILSWQTLERAIWLSIKVSFGCVILLGLVEWALRSLIVISDGSSLETTQFWSRCVDWTSLMLVCAGVSCLLSGLIDAWLRQRRWRLSLELTEDERRRL